MLTAEIIAIGSELLSPSKTDTNSLWLTERLNELGIQVCLKSVVGDDPPRLEETLRDAISRSDIVITTGGLGPTEDDVTRESVARSIGAELVHREDIEEGIRQRFKSFGREMPAVNRRQAYIVDGSEVLPNSNGTAPGIFIKKGEVSIVVLPGPPRELKPMFTDHVIPRINGGAGRIVFRKRVLKVTGLGESAIDEAVAPIYKSFDDVTTGILFNRADVEIHLTSKGADQASADARNEELASLISEKLGTAVYSTAGEEMEKVIGDMLTERGQTLAVAESCTGGLIGERITDVAGSSLYFLEGAVVYSNEAKIRTLAIDGALIEKFGAVSAEVAEAMAEGMRGKSGATYALSVTGVAGPGGGTEEKPVGTVFIAVADANGIKSSKLTLPGDRYLIRWRSSQAALDLLRRRMLD